MIKSFNHKGLQQFFETGTTRGIRADHAKKLRCMLAVIDDIVSVEEVLFLWKCHQLKGSRAHIWSLSVSGNWRLTFEFKNGNADILDYEDYH